MNSPPFAPALVLAIAVSLAASAASGHEQEKHNAAAMKPVEMWPGPASKSIRPQRLPSQPWSDSLRRLRPETLSAP